MTMPKQHAQQTRSEQPERPTPWYRVPVVWLGGLITVMLIFGYAQLVFISHSNAVPRPEPVISTQSGELNKLFGVPLSRQQASGHDEHDNEAQTGTPAAAP